MFKTWKGLEDLCSLCGLCRNTFSALFDANSGVCEHDFKVESTWNT